MVRNQDLSSYLEVGLSASKFITHSFKMKMCIFTLCHLYVKQK